MPYGSIGIPTASIDTLIFVNKEGDRFVKEDARRDVLSKAVLEQTGFQDIQIHKNRNGWLCITARK